MQTSILYCLVSIGGAGLVVAGKVFYDLHNKNVKFKYAKVTDLRLKRKNYNDLKYKSNNNKRSGGLHGGI